MKKEVILCDRCNIEGAITIGCPVNRFEEQAEIESEYEYIDLCHSCTVSGLKYLLGESNYHERRNWFEKMKDI